MKLYIGKGRCGDYLIFQHTYYIVCGPIVIPEFGTARTTNIYNMDNDVYYAFLSHHIDISFHTVSGAIKL